MQLCIAFIAVIHTFYRVKAYINHGWDKNIINQHGTSNQSSLSGQDAATTEFEIPLDSWKPIKQAFSAIDMPKFNNGHIITYFVTCCVIDGLPSGNFKSVSSSAINLFKCGHVQSIEVCCVSPALRLRAICQPEMKKNKLYKLNLVLNSATFHIIYARCGCPAGKGPSGSCKHIGAFCYAFENFCSLGNTPDFFTCTDTLQSWNQPRGPKVDPIPVEMLCERRNELLNKTDRSSVIFDPRPKQFRKRNPNTIEKLRCNLLNKCGKENAAFLTILVPSIANIEHDHTYASKIIVVENQTTSLQDTTTRESSKVKENDDVGEHTKCYRSDAGTPAIMKEKLRYACLVSNMKI